MPLRRPPDARYGGAESPGLPSRERVDPGKADTAPKAPRAPEPASAATPSLPRCLAASLPRCLAASLPRCLAASLPRCLAASLPAGGELAVIRDPLACLAVGAGL